MKSRFDAPIFKWAIAVICSMAAAGGALGQEHFPQRPVETIVPWGPGGGADQLARKIGKLLEADLKTSFPVLNVPGATGNAGMTKLLAAPADGYSIAILIGDTAATLVSGGARWKLSDLTPLGVLMRQNSGFFVQQASRFKTWNDVVTEAKAKPGTIKVAILGFGSVDDMTLGYLAGKGITLVPVPYASPGERYASILGGHVDLLFEQAGDIHSFLDSKQVRPLLFFSEDRVEGFADIPSSKEVGLEIYLPQFRSIVVRAGTDPQRVKLLADAIAKAAGTPEYAAFLKESLARRDSFIPAGEAQKFIAGEIATMQKMSGKK
ncbi:MAG: tripartite tricarboxylate transporter substrate binding protein [Betaproteobacteria bacterium]|nr:tripartite tricarboxylate transporter substrate binding protein [Betaproteobacteria bacterium]